MASRHFRCRFQFIAKRAFFIWNEKFFLCNIHKKDLKKKTNNTLKVTLNVFETSTISVKLRPLIFTIYMRWCGEWVVVVVVGGVQKIDSKNDQNWVDPFPGLGKVSIFFSFWTLEVNNVLYFRISDIQEFFLAAPREKK